MEVGPAELLIILVIVAILFGPGRIANLGGELGAAIHEFRRGLQHGEQAEAVTDKADESQP